MCANTRVPTPLHNFDELKFESLNANRQQEGGSIMFLKLVACVFNSQLLKCKFVWRNLLLGDFSHLSDYTREEAIHFHPICTPWVPRWTPFNFSEMVIFLTITYRCLDILFR